MLPLLSSRQLKEWEIYNEMEPIGLFYPAGMVAAATASVMLGKGFSPFDFYPKIEEAKEVVKEVVKEKVQSMEQMESVMMGMVRSGRATKRGKING